MSADYSQIELRLMAHFSQDPLLLDAYRTGKDIHTLTAAEVFGVDPETMDKETRARAKAVNFGIVYGISPFGLAAQLGIDQKVAKEYIERYFERYRGVRQFIEQTLETVRRDQAVRTAFGRVRPIPDIQSRNPNHARLCRADSGQYAAAGNGGGPDQAGHAAHRPRDGGASAAVADDAAGA